MDMQAIIKHKLSYFQQVKKEIDSRKTKARSSMLRRHWLQKQTVHNYQNEYDRIRGILNTSVTGGLTNDVLNKRKLKLEEMGAKIIDQIV